MNEVAVVYSLDLVTFLHEGNEADKRSVIVEARRPPIDPRIGPIDSFTGTLQEIDKELQQLGIRDEARINELAGHFVVEVTPSQLRQLANLPAVQAIRPNQFHQHRF